MISPALAAPYEFFLENGLKVVFIPNTAAPVATLMVLYRIGARNEAVGYTGSSHLLEHMLFKGTPKNNRANGRAFADIMNEIGASKNATTWLDRTLYFETVPAGYLEFAIELEADRMRSAFIADADRRSEMTVVRNELERNDNNSSRVLNAALVATAFREHPYHHPTIGWRSDVEGVSTDRLRELYDTYYHPDNATAFVIGDFDFDRTRDAIERHFGVLPRAALAIPDVHTQEPPQAGERSVVVKRPGDTTLVAYAYHTPAGLGQLGVLSGEDLAKHAASMPDDNDGYALEVLSRILGRGRTSRFSRALVDTGLALDASAWDWGSRDPGLFQIVVSVRPGVATDDVRRELDAVLATMIERGPETSEIERVRSQIAVARAFAREGTYGLAQRLAEFEAVGSWRLDEDYVERIAAVTPDAVRDVARKYLHDDNRTIGMLVPGVAKTFDVVAFEPVDPPRSAPSIVETAPLPPPRSQRVAAFAGRIARGTLSNGIAWRHVASLETPTVHVRGILEAGLAFSPDRPMLPSVVAELLSRGTRSQPRQAIEERLERAGVRRGYGVDDDASGSYNPLAFRFTGACAAADVGLMLHTIAQELSEPAFAQEELDLVRNEIVGSLRLARTATGWRSAQRFLELAYRPGSVHAGFELDALVADLEALTLDDVRGYYEGAVLASVPLVSVAGAIAEEPLAALLSESFETVPFRARERAALPLVFANEPRELLDRVVLERKSNVDIVLGRATTLVRGADDYLAAAIANGILGQSTLSSRLGLRLRDREGLTYGVTSAFLAPGKLGGPWRVGVSVNPANVERAIASVRDVLATFAQTGPQGREFDAQRNSMAGQHDVALATNAGIAAQLERLAYYDLPDDDVDTYRARLAGVAIEDATSAARCYLGDDNLIIVAAGTFADASATGTVE